MKIKIILFLAISALITLSFTFVSINKSKETKVEQSVKDTSTEPAGGFVAEDKI